MLQRRWRMPLLQGAVAPRARASKLQQHAATYCGRPGWAPSEVHRPRQRQSCLPGGCLLKCPAATRWRRADVMHFAYSVAGKDATI
uniref:Uncharacterized protein n=1 Tax=Arundo donax TaxID=35708 RepID=A0A0A9DFF1_ARUDO